jgi:hypothetical protein
MRQCSQIWLPENTNIESEKKFEHPSILFAIYSNLTKNARDFYFYFFGNLATN